MDDVSEEKSPTNQCIKRRKRKTNKVDKKKANVDDVAKIIDDKKWRKSNQLNF